MNNRYFFSILFCILSVFGVQAQLEVTTDNTMSHYEIGETMNFVVNSSSSGEVEYLIKYDKKATPIATGTIDVSSNQDAYISFSSDVPSLVICEVTKGSKTDEVAAAFSPYDLDAFEEEPADFDQFWTEQKALINAIPMNPVLQFHSDSDYETTYELRLDNIDGRRVYGYISIPTGTGPFPAILTLPPYGDGANIVSPAETLAERGGAISVAINIHNAEPDEQDPNAYEPDVYTDREGIYHRYAMLGAVQAINYIFTRDDFNGVDLGVNGVSQGGGLSTIVAGLDDRVKVLVESNGTMGQHSGLAHDRAAGFPYYVRKAITEDNDVAATVDATRYYDAIFFARRFKGASLSLICYEDEICPPATGFAFYNQFRGPKVLFHALDLGHTHPNEYWKGRLDFYRRHFPSMLTPPWPWPDTEIGYGVDAGPDQSISNACSVELNGQLFLEQEVINTYPVQWVQIEGPGVASFSDANSYNPTVGFSQEGTYILRFSGDDLSNLEDDRSFFTLADYVTIEVSNASNTAPQVELTSSPVVNGTFTIQVNFDQPVSDLTLGDFTIINGTATSISGLGTSYVLTVSPTSQGNVQISLPAMSAVNCTDVGNVVSNTLIVSYEPASGELELNCPEDLVVLAEAGDTEAIVYWANPVSSTTCPIGAVSLTQISGPTSGSSFPLGLAIITYQATDECGNLLQCSFEITVEETEVVPDPDCISESDNPWQEYIRQVELGDINNPSNKTTYSDFTDLATALEKGSTTPFILTIRYTGSDKNDAYIKVWIDFNGDGVFDESSETVVSTIFTNYENGQIFTINETISVPATATNGAARMRVALKRGSFSTPCENFEHGEVEDYTINIFGSSEPEIIHDCQPDILAYAPVGSSQAMVSWGPINPITTCPDQIINVVPISGLPSGSMFPIGTSEVSYIVIDLCENSVLCSFTVTVEPEPTIINLLDCPEDILAYSPSGPAPIGWAAPTANSNCPTGNINVFQTAGPQNGELFPIGETIIEYTLNDDCGNLVLCNFTVTVVAEAQDYCESQGDFPWADYIYRVELEDIDNVSGKKSYSDFLDESTDLTIGETYPIELTAKFSYFNHDEYWKVWIDFNQDGIFHETKDVVFTGFTVAEPDGNSTTAIEGTVFVPFNALPGETRMRVSKKRDSYPTPCESFEYGEVEDYTINILSTSPINLELNNNGHVIHSEKASNDYEVTEDAIHLFPNPVTSQLNIDLSAFLDDEVQLEVVDGMGLVILDQKFTVEENIKTIDCRQYVTGVFAVRVISKGHEIVTEKFVKTRL